jgi:fused signal recognition particle receptor
MFNFIKSSLQKIYSSITNSLSCLFSRATIDEKSLKELEIILLSADTGVKTTRVIMDKLQKAHQQGNLKEGTHLRITLQDTLIEILSKPTPVTFQSPSIFLLVGINGSGKTTFAAKLAYYWQQQGKKVLLVAADTFRAAATEQLEIWAKKSSIPLVLGHGITDPSAVVFQGCATYKKEQFDILIIDTAGRLQTKVNLMHELTKIKRVINKQLPNLPIHTLLTIDAMLGQNSFEQAKLFKESTDVTSIVLTKMDGTGKGGIVFAISHELNIPIQYISYGEHNNQMKLFNSQEFVHDLLHE